MKQLVILTMTLLVTVFVVHSQPPSSQSKTDTICLPVPEVQNSLRVKDSLSLMKVELNKTNNALEKAQFIIKSDERIFTIYNKLADTQARLVETKDSIISVKDVMYGNLQKDYSNFKLETKVKIKNKNKTIALLSMALAATVGTAGFLLIR